MADKSRKPKAQTPETVSVDLVLASEAAALRDALVDQAALLEIYRAIWSHLPESIKLQELRGMEAWSPVAHQRMAKELELLEGRKRPPVFGRKEGA